MLGRIRAARGQPGATELLSEAKTLADATAEMQRLGPVYIARAEAAWLAGDLPGTAAEAGTVFELSLGRDSPWIRGMLAVCGCWSGSAPRRRCACCGRGAKQHCRAATKANSS